MIGRLLCWLGLHDQIIRKTRSSDSRGFVRKVEVTNCARCGRGGFIETKRWELPK